ncbi:MAG: sigma-70 family RNA polymerase sigma factor [Bacteroidota bacterium]
MDQEAFVSLIKKYQSVINKVCYCYFSSQENRKDARQEIILQLWKSYPSFQRKSKVSTWIYRVALNTVLNLVRKNRDIPLKESSEHSISLISEAAFNDDVEYLKHLINCLKEVDKGIVLLYLEGYSNKEISQILSLSETNVSSRLCRVRQHLRKLHNTKYYEIK